MTEPSFDQQLDDWQRLSPLSILFFIGKIIGAILKDGVTALAPLGIVIFSSDNKLWLTLSIVAAFLAFILISSLLQYWFFKFKRDGNKVLINDGVFKKNHRVIQFDRIQNINILQPLYFKPFNLFTLQIETAGAKGNEADLAGITRAFAEYLRNQVLQQKEKSSSRVEDNEQVIETEANILTQASLKDLVKYGVSSNGVFWFFAILAPLFPLLENRVGDSVNKETFLKFEQFLGGGIGADAIIIIGIILAAIILMFSFSIIGAIIRYYNYQLTLENNQATSSNKMLKRSSGLLTNYEESLKLQKIQTMITQSNFIGRWLKIINITLGQVSSSQNTPNNRKSLFVIPARTDEETLALQKNVFVDAPNDIETQGISRRYVNKTLILKIILPALAICLPLYLTSDKWWFLVIPFVFTLIMFPLVIKRWKAYRFGMKDGYAKFERGLFGFRHMIFPLYKVQRAEVRQSPIQKRHDLATLKIYLASGQIQMQYISIKVANQWLDIIGNHIEETQLAWY